MPLDRLPGTFFGPSNLVDLLRHRVRHQADAVAFTWLVDGENEQVDLGYRELDREARAIAAWLQSKHLSGERALLCYPPGLEFVSAFFGCLYAGVVAVPVYPPRRNQLHNRIQAIAEDAEARVALTTDAVLKRIRPLVERTPSLRGLQWLASCHVPAGMEEQWEAPKVFGDTLAFLQYTSGSTGRPKGVTLSHANLMHNSALIAHCFEHTRSGMGVFWLPSYHDMGLIGGILQPLFIGRPNVMMAPMAFLQRPYRWLAAISRFGGTTSGGPNFAYDLCVRKISPKERATLDLRSWQVAFNGAEPVHAETLDRFCEAFGPCGFRPEAFYPCYGLAEATLIVSGGYPRQPPTVRAFDAAGLARREVIERDPDDPAARQLVGCGEALPDGSIVIVDPETRTRLPAQRIGEIWTGSPSIARGYWKRPEETRDTFHAYLADGGDGPFLRTGDLGFLIDGELFVVGRIKDVLIVRGLNHYPQDIEATVEKCHPMLRPGCSAAFAVETEGREELVVLCEVERRARGDPAPIFAAIRRAVAEEHEIAVSGILLLKAGSIPKTSSGKIQRHACRDAYLEGSLAVVGRWSQRGEGSPPPAAAEAAPEPAGETRDARTGQRPERRRRNGEPARGGPGETVGQVHLRVDRPTSLPPNGARQPSAAQSNVAEIVLEEVRKVAKQRANGLTLDTVIAEIGLDSLERMEILASIEERFGGRFPEEIFPDLETCAQLIEAVDRYLVGNGEPRRAPALPPDAEIPPETYRIEQFPECLRLKANLEFIESSGLENPFFHVHQGVLTNRTVIGGRELINFSSFNYLGMSGHPAVAQAAKEAIDRYGTSVSASRLVSGEKDLHLELERTLARFLGAEDAIVFAAGHSTNETVIGHLFGPGDLILHDALAHNSIVQGAVLSGARRRPFAHNDPKAADQLLATFRRDYRRVLIAIEGVYSMDGDFPNLPEFLDVKRRHKAILLIDEAHSLGTLGPHGRGIGEFYDVDRQEVELWMGTLSKSLGSGGGYIAGSAELVRYLRYTAPGFVFATGISPPNTAAALAALRVLEAEPQRVARLRQRSELFLSLAKHRGLNTGTSNGTPVVPIILGNSIHCLMVSKAMLARGINVRPILHPAVEESAARLRFFITSEHTEEEIRYAVDALAEELERLSPEYLAGEGSRETSSPRTHG